MKQTRIIIIAIVAFIGIMILLLLPRKELTEEQKIKAWKPRDFYLVYQYYFDQDLIELRKEINENQQRAKVGL
jgi:hypothetical protein